MKKMFFYRSILPMGLFLYATETVADNPFDWKPYEHGDEEPSQPEPSQSQESHGPSQENHDPSLE